MNIKLLQSKKDRSEILSTTIIRVLLILFMTLSLYPLFFVLITSLKTTSEFLGDIWALPTVMHWENYSVAWVDGHIGEYFLNSIIVTFTSVSCILIFASCAGYALAKLRVPFTELFVGMLLLIIVLPTESLIMPLYIFMVKLKLINTPYVPMILAYIGWCMPFSILLLKNFFQALPNEILEAAKVDGCSELQTLVRIVAPLMAPAIGTCTVFNFCYIWGELMWAQISTASVVKGLTLPIGLITFQGQYDTNWGPMSAAICVILIPLFIMFLFLQKYFIEGLTAGAVKG